jgi:hypothetical protein
MIRRAAFMTLLACIGMLPCVSEPFVCAQDKPQPPQRMPVVPSRDSSSTAGRGGASDSAAVARLRFPSFDVPEYTITGDEARGMTGARPLAALFPAGGLLRSGGPGLKDQFGGMLGGTRPDAGAPHSGMNGGVRLGYGTFGSPMMSLWFSPGNERAHGLLDVGFSSTRGHVSNADAQQAHSDLSAGFTLGNARVHAGFGMAGNGYRLYGSNTPERKRTVTGFHADGGFSSLRIGKAEVAAGMQFSSTAVEDSLRTSEQQLGFTVGVDWRVGDVDLTAGAVMWSNAYTTGGSDLNPNLSTVSLRARFPLMQDLDGEAGVAAGVQRGTDAHSLGWIDPIAALYWRGLQDLTLFLRFEPHAERPSLATMLEENPYVVSGPHIRARHYSTDLHLGAAWRPSQDVRASAEFFVTKGQSVAVYVDADSAGIWTPDYSGVVSSTGVQASCEAVLTPADEISGTLTIRGNRWSRTDDAVPYMSGFDLDVYAVHRFDFGLRLVPSLHVIGSRPVNVLANRSLSSYLDIGLRAEYIVLPSLTASLALENILGTKRTIWERYTGVPSVATVSASFSW